MSCYRLTHLDDATLLRELTSLVARDRTTTAALIAHMAEVDVRRLYLPAAYPSMHDWCVGALGLAEEAAYKRIRAARAARRFPRLFDDIAEGRLHLSAIVLLAPHLTAENVDELVAVAAGRPMAELEARLAARFGAVAGAAAVPARMIAVGPVVAVDAPAPGPIEVLAEPEPVDSLATWPVNSPVPTRHIVQFTIDDETHAIVRRLQDLLAYSLPSGDVGAVFVRGARELLARLEKKKAAATDRPRPASKGAPRGRNIPAHVRRAVWERDGARCTFTSATGRRCESRRGLEFDHVVAFARGGQSNVEGLRVRCRAHNQFEAERTFGAEFMRRKREKAHGQARQAPRLAPGLAPRADADLEVESALRGLGCRAAEARSAALHGATAGPGGRIEDRLRTALQFLGANGVGRVSRPAPA